MNLFVTSRNPRECAEALDDARLRKMIVETGQIMSAVAFLNPIMFPNHMEMKWRFYKPTHLNHPVVQWAKANSFHLGWTRDHFWWLTEEYQHRFRKPHMTRIRLWPAVAEAGAMRYPKLEFCRCNPHTMAPNVFESYRSTLRDKWVKDREAGRPPKWSNRCSPLWSRT